MSVVPLPQEKNTWYCLHTSNEGRPVRIQYKCLVPIYVFPKMKLLFPKHNCNVLSPSSYTHISVRDLYISWIGLPIYSDAGNYVDRSWEFINCSQTHECGNCDWGRAIPWKGMHKWNFQCSAGGIMNLGPQKFKFIICQRNYTGQGLSRKAQI